MTGASLGKGGVKVLSGSKTRKMRVRERSQYVTKLEPTVKRAGGAGTGGSGGRLGGQGEARLDARCRPRVVISVQCTRGPGTFLVRAPYSHFSFSQEPRNQSCYYPLLTDEELSNLPKVIQLESLPRSWVLP